MRWNGTDRLPATRSCSEHRDSTPVVVSASSHFYYARNGTIAGVEGIFHDITAIRKAQQQIQLLTGLNDTSPASVIVHTPDGEMLYANQRTFEMHGWTQDEFMALNLHRIDVPASEELIRQRLGELRIKGETAFEVGHYPERRFDHPAPREYPDHAVERSRCDHERGHRHLGSETGTGCGTGE